MARRDEEENWLDAAFAEEPAKAAPQKRPVAKGDEDDWLEAAFNDAAPVKKGMSTAAKVLVAIAVLVALGLAFMLAKQLLGILGAMAAVGVA